MLVVVNPRIDPQSTFRGWMAYNSKLIAVMLIWSAALLCISTLAQFDNSSDRWYSVSFAEGVPIYTPYMTEEDCLQGVPGDTQECISGQNLF